MFSDESRFSLQSDSRRTLIWRAPGTRYHRENTIERHRYVDAGCHVCGGIILGSRTVLHVQSITLTGHIYRDVFLDKHWITEGKCTVADDVQGTQIEDRAIRRVATSAPITSLASIQRQLPPSRHPVPSRETIRRRLGLRSRRPLRRLPLTPHHRQCRLDFADLGQLGV
ncbi:transposable element Tcb1 transposase [Trichonephila clavipes]|nr:transposable element Tcb1 transposase [Trichonephila clavipes]